jgi:lipid II isoglutaminyl synthase (glutamine-hydrolysing)
MGPDEHGGEPMTTPHKPRHAAPTPPDAGHSDEPFAEPEGPASWATTSAQTEAAASMSGQPGPASPAAPADAAPADAAPAAVAPAEAAPAAVAPADAAPAAVAPADASPPSQPEQSRAAGPARRGISALRLIWVYPDLLSTYGDRGNLLVLERRARLRGIEVEPIEVNSDQPVPRQGDIYLMGGGEDLPQILAARRLRADAGLTAAADKGAVVFAVCAGYQVIGTEFGGVDGEPVEGLGILNIRSGRGEHRGVGEIVADVDPDLGVPRLTGFENHQGVTTLGRGVKPLARVTLGVGNGDGTEGAYARAVIGTYLHGPALVRNPGLADLLLSWAAGPLEPLDNADENWACLLREERLAAASG